MGFSDAKNHLGGNHALRFLQLLILRPLLTWVVLTEANSFPDDKGGIHVKGY